MERRVVACLPVDDRHTGDNIVVWLKEAIQSCNIGMDKVVALVHDNGSNVVSAGKKLDNELGWASVRCAAHTLQLVVHAVLRCDEVITGALATARQVVEHFKRSELASSNLRKAQHQMSVPEHHLVMEVSTRWNSTLYMVERLLEQRWPVSVVLLDKKNDVRNKSPVVLSDQQWQVLSNFRILLKPLEAATTYLSGEAYVTASSVPSLISWLCSKMTTAADDATYVKTFKQTALRELHERWPITVSRASEHRNMCPVILCASVVDPRFKLMSVEPGMRRVVELSLIHI